ncbi:MAG: ATP-binding protein, partial [Flavobacteriales bacterium]|nr:ATP-binding protein [Flavobacteriales bacterium]
MAEDKVQYTEDNIRSLDWKEHIRLRPGMYIGKLGDGKSADDGIYILVKEVVDNCIDEFVMGNGRRIVVKIKEDAVSIRDWGRGIPLGKVVDVVSKMNTGGKYDSKAFKKSVGLNGVGTKAVNALSSYFKVQSFREGQEKTVEFDRGNITKDHDLVTTDKENGTYVKFVPDADVFKAYHFRSQYLDKLFWNYCYLNRGLTIEFNSKRFHS